MSSVVEWNRRHGSIAVTETAETHVRAPTILLRSGAPTMIRDNSNTLVYSLRNASLCAHVLLDY